MGGSPVAARSLQERGRFFNGDAWLGPDRLLRDGKCIQIEILAQAGI
jgi:hypothetical protein